MDVSWFHAFSVKNLMIFAYFVLIPCTFQVTIKTVLFGRQSRLLLGAFVFRGFCTAASGFYEEWVAGI